MSGEICLSSSRDIFSVLKTVSSPFSSRKARRFSVSGLSLPNKSTFIAARLITPDKPDKLVFIRMECAKLGQGVLVIICIFRSASRPANVSKNILGADQFSLSTLLLPVIGINEVKRLVALKKRRFFRKKIRRENIVAVQLHHQLPASFFVAAVRSAGKTPVLLADDADFVSKTFQNFRSPVRRAIINNQNFIIFSGKILRQGAFNRALNVILGIISRNNKRCFHIGIISYLYLFFLTMRVESALSQ